MTRRLFSALLPTAFLFVIGLHPTAAHALWPQNGGRVASISFGQSSVTIASDGQGGALIAWVENRSGQFSDIYAQRLDAWGNPVWAPGGVAVAIATWDQINPTVVSDGAGGGIIVWEDYRNGFDSDVYAQRIDASGATMWAANGLVVCAQPFNQVAIRMIPDAPNGAILVWHDVRGNPDWNIYAQKINGAGVAQWPVNGLAICVEPGNQFRPDLVSDGLGGAIFAWEHEVSFQYDIRAQRVSVFGGLYFATAGLVLCGNGNNQGDPKLVSDGLSGAIVTWRDERTGVFNTSTFAQRVTPNGGVPWTIDGVDLCSAGYREAEQQIISDGANGAIVAWTDGRSPGEIVAQKINLGGALQWPSAGVLVSSSPSQKLAPRMTTDGLGGAIISWLDYRYEFGGDTFARRIDTNGVGIGTGGGVPIAVVYGNQLAAPLASDDQGGAIITWVDGREMSYVSAFAQRLDRFNNWGYPAAEIVSASDVPGDQGGVVNVAWNASRLDLWPNEDIDRYTVWRAIDATLASVFATAGAPVVSLEELDPAATEAIRIETLAGTTYYWQLMSTVDAYYLGSYAQAVPTLFDNTISSPGYHYFQVIAHGLTPPEYWISAPASGVSLDNLAPAAPIMLTAERVGDDVHLIWNPSGANEADFDEYAVYRASTTGVQPLPGSFVSGTVDTVLVDSSPPVGFLYYIVTARDTHDNQSTPSNEASVAIPTGVPGDTPSLTRLTLDTNVPNPFSASTSLRIGLPRASDVQLEVFDVAGRRVVVRDIPRVSAGWQRIAFDGRDAHGKQLASGVYFGRITAAGETQTMKMVIQR